MESAKRYSTLARVLEPDIRMGTSTTSQPNGFAMGLAEAMLIPALLNGLMTLPNYGATNLQIIGDGRQRQSWVGENYSVTTHTPFEFSNPNAFINFFNLHPALARISQAVTAQFGAASIELSLTQPEPEEGETAAKLRVKICSQNLSAKEAIACERQLLRNLLMDQSIKGALAHLVIHAA